MLVSFHLDSLFILFPAHNIVDEHDRGLVSQYKYIDFSLVVH